jgi:hypothetical protein
VAGLVALAALDTLGGAGLGALLGVVAFLLAVLAGERVLALLGAIARAVAVFLAVDALDSGGVGLVLGDLLSAALGGCQ